MPGSDWAGSFYGDAQPLSQSELNAYNLTVANGLQPVAGGKGKSRPACLEDLSVKELVARAVKLNIAFSGKKKAELISAIRKARGQKKH